MDKKKLITSIVFFGIGLSLLALGIYIIVMITGNPFYNPGKFNRIFIPILIGFSFVFGLISAIYGGINIYKSKKS
ncbi:MAG: hypothetical protein ACETWK_02830 [Candidatus Aminicenantaceae bacterium]